MWTRFMDMHSGGSLKEKQQYIYIEAPQREAEIIFYNRFGHNPYRVTCPCCGEDYSIDEEESLDQITAYDRGCDFIMNSEEKGGGHYIEEPSKWVDKVLSVEEYFNKPDVLKISKEEILPHEREGSLPTQGYVWID